MDVREAMKKQNEVAMFLSWHLFSTVAKRSNSVFSPASINAAFTMMASGPGSSVIADKILSFLRSSSIDELNSVFSVIATFVFADGSHIGGPTVKVVNGAWIDQSLYIDPSTNNLFYNFFKAVLASVDFKSKAEELRMEVNAWALHYTNGFIKDLLPHGSVPDDTIWIYGNALYFKGAWEDKFHKSMTKDQDFHLLDGTSVSVPFLSSHKNQYIKAYDGFKVLKLPFRQGLGDTSGSFSMYFYLPDEKDGLDDLVERMASSLGFLDSHIPSQKVDVGEFRIPKFKIEFGFSALKTFNILGLDRVELYQKACVEIDEEGAEAATATAVVGIFGCAFVKRIDFVADHPFLFMIKEDKTGTPLFVGQIFDPSKSS
ncbi:PREDICTED: serpin-Z1-like [Camelina sativa]|uniref:Serpin-Z1-like n=1 Tax=Camelina sativa TaxID=90675 RepID=A0ABM0SZM0_CAMSA|nr:PREDICTED: serpin-Z1-like [Camelina sativa]